MNATTYKERRSSLLKRVGSGVILLVANKHLPRNYAANTLPFRQDSSFLYYTGIDIPDLYCLLNCESGEEKLIGQEATIEDTIWSGSVESLEMIAQKASIAKTMEINRLTDLLTSCKDKKCVIHYLPPYTADRVLELGNLLGKTQKEIKSSASTDLIKAVISQRIIKSEAEVSEIETALNKATVPMYLTAMRMAKQGVYEYQIVAEMYKQAKEHNMEMAYPVICSVRGEVLHNESHNNKLEKGQLLLIDAGAESHLHYASDITRTIPVGGKFSDRQKAVYETVLEAQVQALNSIRPGVSYKEIHLQAALAIARGLKQIGLMQGDMEEAVRVGAHALFFPHGLGHSMGLDVHDMEDLGENLVGYDDEIKRSSQFGLAYLRMARVLQPGYVITVEPGIYFIPSLIDQWEADKKFAQFISYGELHKYLDFGGIRIEDNVFVTPTGGKVLGQPIPKTVSEIESLYNV
jgi:Xaa-Pro aminopeptidase